MYETHWKLTCNPFAEPFDPRFFFGSHTHQAGLLKLRYLVENRKGVGLLVGDGGCGKTSLISQLAHILPDEYAPVVHLVFPHLTPPELLAYLAVKLGADPGAVDSRDTGVDTILREVESHLTTFAREGRHPIIVIDEAHAIEDAKCFAALQHLLNYRRPPESDFSLILVGESSLLPRVRRIPGLEERVTVKSLLRPLTREEIAGYTTHRLKAAGLTREVFDATAFDELFQLSGGIPRRINRICDLALLVGYADRLTTLSASHVTTVAKELTSIASD